MLTGRNFKYKHTGGGSIPVPPVTVPQFYVGNAAAVAGGTGDGLSAANPCLFSAVWAKVLPVASQGPDINMVGTNPATDGHYTGANSMITPPAGLAGVVGHPIVIRAINDGGCWIDGQGLATTVNLDGPTNRNDYFTLQGFDASNNEGSTGHSTIHISANHVTCQRIVAWDAEENFNVHVWSIAGRSAFDPDNANNILIEDCAGFGFGRKIIENYGNVGPNCFRRFWGRWEASTCTGPKRMLQDVYSARNLTVDNMIIRVYSLLANPYTLTDVNGIPAVYPTGTSCTQGNPNAPVAGQCQYPGTNVASDSIINEGTGWAGENQYNAAADGSNVNCNNSLNGILTLQLSGEPIAMLSGTTRGMWEHKQYGNTNMKDIFVYVAPGVVDQFRGDTGSLRSFVLAAGANDGLGHVAAQCTLTNATSLSPNSATDSITAKYTVTNKLTGTTLASLGTGSLYNGASGATRGAAIRYRYSSGVLTGTPLWPWPMSARIKAATTRASADGHGHVVEDIDATIQATFGAFP